jgi:hypothetical protein
MTNQKKPSLYNGLSLALREDTRSNNNSRMQMDLEGPIKISLAEILPSLPFTEEINKQFLQEIYESQARKTTYKAFDHSSYSIRFKDYAYNKLISNSLTAALDIPPSDSLLYSIASKYLPNKSTQQSYCINIGRLPHNITRKYYQNFITADSNNGDYLFLYPLKKTRDKFHWCFGISNSLNLITDITETPLELDDYSDISNNSPRDFVDLSPIEL